MTDITLFILDKNKRIIDVVSNAGTEENAFWDDTFTQEINVASIFEFSLELNQLMTLMVMQKHRYIVNLYHLSCTIALYKKTH